MKPKKEAFTPGPWTIGSIAQHDESKENRVANVRGLYIWGGYAAIQCINDARLISASLDLYNAAVDALSAFMGESAIPESVIAGRLQAAIAKATGEGE